MIRDSKDPKVGEWILPASYLYNGVCGRPREVISVTKTSVVGREHIPGGNDRRFRLHNIAFVTPDAREAERAFEMSEAYRRRVADERETVTKAIKALDFEPVV